VGVIKAVEEGQVRVEDVSEHVEHDGLVFDRWAQLDERHAEILAERDDVLGRVEQQAFGLECHGRYADGAHGVEELGHFALGELLERKEARDDELPALAPILNVGRLEHHGARQFVVESTGTGYYLRFREGRQQ
jgi:hypothetical protein